MKPDYFATGWTRREAIAGATALGLGATPLRATTAAKPNILWITADHLGFADLSFAGRYQYRSTGTEP